MKITILILAIIVGTASAEAEPELFTIEEFMALHTDVANVTTDGVSIDDLQNTHPLSCSLPDEDGTHSGLPQESSRWRNGIVFQYDHSFSDSEVNIINSAIFELSKVLCIKFLFWGKGQTPSGDYVFIKKGGPSSGCNAAVGRQGGRQQINLEAPGCIHPTVITHETIHALGFLHEHTRPDRDHFVDIFNENIIPSLKFNFAKAEGTLTFDVPYDWLSIMHYSSDAFSSNGRSTILTKSGQKIPYNFQLRQSDKEKLRAMYKCK